LKDYRSLKYVRWISLVSDKKYYHFGAAKGTRGKAPPNAMRSSEKAHQGKREKSKKLFKTNVIVTVKLCQLAL